MSARIHGKESVEHNGLKQASVCILRRAPYCYDAHLYEARHCDVVLFRREPRRVFVLGAEVQLSDRHIAANSRRDLRFCHHVLFVTPDVHLAGAVVRQLAKLTREEQDKISVAAYRDAALVPVKGKIP